MRVIWLAVDSMQLTVFVTIPIATRTTRSIRFVVCTRAASYVLLVVDHSHQVVHVFREVVLAHHDAQDLRLRAMSMDSQTTTFVLSQATTIDRAM